MRASRSAVLVTGGAGFVGSHIVRRLITTRRVHVLDNLSSGEVANVPAGATLHIGDVRSKDDILRALVPEVQAIVHCAAQTSVSRSIADPATDWETNILGTHNVTSLARTADIGRIVFFSSGGAVYGETPRTACDAEMPRPASYYGLNKYAGEQIVRLEAPSWAILRPSNVYGARQRTDLEGGVVSIFLDRLLRGEPVDVFGDGLQQRDFVYIDDVVRAVELGLEGRENVVWNVSSGRATSVLELLETLQSLTGIEVPIRRRPARPGDVRSSHLAPDRLLATGCWGPPVDLRTGLSRLLSETETPRDGSGYLTAAELA